jgi:hypothetical protein
LRPCHDIFIKISLYGLKPLPSGRFPLDARLGLNEQLKSLSESRIAGLGMLTQGQDMLDMRAIPQLRTAASNFSGAVPFGVMGGHSCAMTPVRTSMWTAST